MMFGLPWLTWIALGFNFGAAFVNSYAALRMRRRIQRWDTVRAEWEASRQRVEQYADHFGKLLAFVVALAHSPDGALPDGLRSTARSLIPPDVEFVILQTDHAPHQQVH